MSDETKCVVAKQQSQVFAECKYLSQSVSRLHEGLDELAIKLGPILTEPQTVEDPVIGSNATVRVASWIQEQRRTIDQAIQRVNDLSERSETYE